MDLHPEEPDLGPWRSVDDAELLALVGQPSLVLVDRPGVAAARPPSPAVSPGCSPPAWWDDWMTEEEPFYAADRPRERADLVVLGTPPDAGTRVGQGR